MRHWGRHELRKELMEKDETTLDDQTTSTVVAPESNTSEEVQSLRNAVKEMQDQLDSKQQTIAKLRQVEREFKTFKPHIEKVWSDLTDGVSEGLLKSISGLPFQKRWEILSELKGKTSVDQEKVDSDTFTFLDEQKSLLRPKQVEFEKPADKYKKAKSQKEMELGRPLNTTELQQLSKAYLKT